MKMTRHEKTERLAKTLWKFWQLPEQVYDVEVWLFAERFVIKNCDDFSECVHFICGQTLYHSKRGFLHALDGWNTSRIVSIPSPTEARERLDKGLGLLTSV